MSEVGLSGQLMLRWNLVCRYNFGEEGEESRIGQEKKSHGKAKGALKLKWSLRVVLVLKPLLSSVMRYGLPKKVALGLAVGSLLLRQCLQAVF